MNVSVIVVAFNEALHIKNCIDSILNALVSFNFELIVVDDGSQDGTLSLLETYADKIQLIKSQNHGPSHARNIALQQSRYPWVIFFDADCKVDQQCIAKLVYSMQTLSSKNIDSCSVGGKQVADKSASTKEKNHAWFLERLSFVSDYIQNSADLIEVKHAPTCNVIYQKESIKKIGGFDEKLWPCEDLDLDIRLKKILDHKVYHHPEAWVEHRRPQTKRGILNMFFRYGFGHGLLFKKHGPTQYLHILPALALMIGVLLFFNMLKMKVFLGFMLAVMGLNVTFWWMQCKNLRQSLLFSILLIGCLLTWHFGFIKALFSMRTRFEHD